MDVIEAWNKYTNRRCNCTNCFYCDKQLGPHQHDHFPIPERAGGTERVPACIVCHDLKDRYPLMYWDLQAYGLALSELMNSLSNSTKSKYMCEKPSDSARIIEICSPEWKASWGSLSPLARILYAKMQSIHADYLPLI